jgi:hypothetical protein
MKNKKIFFMILLMTLCSISYAENHDGLKENGPSIYTSVATIPPSVTGTCGLCATSPNSGTACCDAPGPFNPSCTCSLGWVCEGETMDFTLVQSSTHVPMSCTTTDWDIYDACPPGTLLYSYPGVSGNTLSLNTTGMPPGIYWIQQNICGCGTALYSFEVRDCEPPKGGCDRCMCDNEMNMYDFMVNVDGDAVTTLDIGPGSLPGPITKLRVTLINYTQNVDEGCKKCDIANQELFGDILWAPQLYGANPAYGQYHYNIGISYSREVTWCFEEEIAIFDPDPMIFRLKFPPVHDLECCKNSAMFCFRVEIWNALCEACDQVICNYPPLGPLDPITPSDKTKKVKPAVPEGKIKAVPNPTRNGFDLKISDTDVPGEAFIYDSNGTLMRQIKVTRESTSVDAKGFTPGVYLIKYKNSKNIYEDKIVISK